MAKDIYFNDTKNSSEYSRQNSSWNSDAFKEKLEENGVAFRGSPVPTEGTKSTKRPPAKKKKKKMGKAKKVFCALLAAVLLLCLITAGEVGIIFAKYKASDYTENAYISSGMLKKSAGVTNILLMGVDNADLNSDSRSDSMILLSVDTLHGKLKLTSFMRDMFVEVPGYGKTKLTHACQYGGAQLTADTIEMNFGIQIDAYAKIGYDFLKDVVDGLGGITVPEIDEKESAALAREHIDIAPGKNVKLNGIEALNYCRIRKGQSDFQRTERQREMITLIVKKALRSGPLKITNIARSVIGEISCSIPKAQVFGMVFKILPCLMKDIEQLRLPADGEWWDATVSGMSVLEIDLEANKQILDEFIYG